MKIVLAFHEHVGCDGIAMPVSLPQWVLEIGKENQDIFFTDQGGMRNTECLTWGIDKERVLRGRTGIEVLNASYFISPVSFNFLGKRNPVACFLLHFDLTFCTLVDAS